MEDNGGGGDEQGGGNGGGGDGSVFAPADDGEPLEQDGVDTAAIGGGEHGADDGCGGHKGGPAAPLPSGARLDPEPAAYWDATHFYSAFGEYAHEAAGEGEVCCRVCGEPTEHLWSHVGNRHDLSKAAYERIYPPAPSEPPENEKEPFD